MAESTPGVPERATPGRGQEVSGATRSDAYDKRYEKKTGAMSELLAPLAGFGVSFATQFRKVHTEEYPEEKRPTAPRFHGRHQLNRHPDGLV